MIDSQPIRLARRMQRIREQQQRLRDAGLFGRQHRRLASAIGLATEINRGNDLTHRRYRFLQPLAVSGGTRGRWRSSRTPLAERQVATQNAEPGRRQHGGGSDQKRRPAIAAGTMGQHQRPSRGCGRPVQEPADAAALEDGGSGAAGRRGQRGTTTLR